MCYQGRTHSGGTAETQGRHAAVGDDRGGRAGRWARAAAPALGVEAGGGDDEASCRAASGGGHGWSSEGKVVI